MRDGVRTVALLAFALVGDVLVAPGANAGGDGAAAVMQRVASVTRTKEHAWTARLVTVGAGGVAVVQSDVLQWANRFRVVSVAVEKEPVRKGPLARVDTYCDGARRWLVDHRRGLAFSAEIPEHEAQTQTGPLTPSRAWLEWSPAVVKEAGPYIHPKVLGQWSLGGPQESGYLRRGLVAIEEEAQVLVNRRTCVMTSTGQESIVPGLEGSLELVVDPDAGLPLKLVSAVRRQRQDTYMSPETTVTYFFGYKKYRVEDVSVFTPKIPQGYRIIQCDSLETWHR